LTDLNDSKQEFSRLKPQPSMLRLSVCQLAVAPFARFLMESKGKAELSSSHNCVARSRVLAAKYYAIRSDPVESAALLRRAAATPPSPRKTDIRPLVSCSSAVNNFRRFLVKNQIIQGPRSRKEFAGFSSRTSDIWNVYKEFAAEAGSALSKGQNEFDKNMATMAARQVADRHARSE
jgi:hypothetical protein